jgi:hypothetical protein
VPTCGHAGRQIQHQHSVSTVPQQKSNIYNIEFGFRRNPGHDFQHLSSLTKLSSNMQAAE